MQLYATVAAFGIIIMPKIVTTPCYLMNKVFRSKPRDLHACNKARLKFVRSLTVYSRKNKTEKTFRSKPRDLYACKSL